MSQESHHCISFVHNNKYLAPVSITSVSISVWSVVSITISIVSKTISIGTVPGISISLWVSFRFSFSFPLLSSPVPISISVWPVVTTIVRSAVVSIVTQAISIIAVPGVSIGFSIGISYRGGLSFGFPFLFSPISITSISVSIVGSVVSIVSKAITIGMIVRISISISSSCGFSFCFPLFSSPVSVSIWPIVTAIVWSVSVVSKTISRVGIPRVSIGLGIWSGLGFSLCYRIGSQEGPDNEQALHHQTVSTP